MQIDTEHVRFWMQAIRNSDDPKRTLEAFWDGQIRSKEWLIQNLSRYIHDSIDIDIHGGWVGALASMLFQSGLPIKHIISVDIDPVCQRIATTMNQLEANENRFSAITHDMCQCQSTADVVINTSCEHLTQEQYDRWLNVIQDNELLVLQSNNYEYPEHIRIAHNLEEFVQQSHIKVLWSGELELPLYTRYMIIGKKNVPA